MPKSRPPYPAEFRNKIVELARAGRPIPEIAAPVRALGTDDPQLDRTDRSRRRPSQGRSDQRRARGAQRFAGRTGSSSSSARSWQRPRPGSHGRPTRSPTRVRIRERESGLLSRGDHVPTARSLRERLLRVVRRRRRDARSSTRRCSGASVRSTSARAGPMGCHGCTPSWSPRVGTSAASASRG